MKLIPLSGEAGDGKFAMVDEEDFPLLNRITWNLTDHGYARSTDGKIYMHILVFGLTIGAHGTVDHRNRIRLDNQKLNLRHATKQRQMMNQGKRGRPASSKYKGVCLRTASITATRDGQQKMHHLGYHATETGAAHAYDKKARELFGEYASPNFPKAKAA